MNIKLYTLFFLLFLLPCSTQAQIITTIAGSSTSGYCGDNGSATIACLTTIRDVEVDDSGNVYIADDGNYCIRKVDKFGIITTIVGTPGSGGYNGDNGPAVLAQIANAYGIALDSKHNLYIADESNHRIRKIDAAGIITTVAGTGFSGFSGDSSAATLAKLSAVSGVAIDKTGNIYIADFNNNRIRKVDTFGIITTIAGTGALGFGGDNGPATAATLLPERVCTDSIGNVYFTDAGLRVRKIDTAGIITTIAGNGTYGSLGDGGPATAAELAGSDGVRCDTYGNIYIADFHNNKIRKVNSSGIINTIAGNGVAGFGGDNGSPLLADLAGPAGVAISVNGNVFIADMINARVRMIRYNVGVNDLSGLQKHFTTYPNPSNGVFKIAITTTKQEKIEITITNLLGKQVHRLTANTNTEINIELEEPDGMYFLSAVTASGTYTEKIIIQC